MKRVLVLLLACLVLGAGAIQGTVSLRQRAGWQRLRAEMSEEARSGSLQGLLRARLAGARVLATGAPDPALTAELAFLSAWLAHTYGLRAEREAEEALARAEREAGAAAPEVRAVIGASRALLALGRGDRARAEALALEAADCDHDDVRPLLALARARALGGDLAGAGKALEAAMVKAPGAGTALVAWAEGRIDLGQPAAAVDALGQALAAAPDDTRARLLLDEARRALGGDAAAGAGDAEALAAACARDGAVSPVVAAACALRTAEEARLRGDRARALAHAEAAAGAPPAEPRTLARAALTLAQLGRVDQADALVARAERLADPRSPMLVWARAAVVLGRGELVDLPPAPAPMHAETRLLAARAALAGGGPRALAQALAALGPAAVAGDPDLGALAAVAPAAAPAAAPTASGAPATSAPAPSAAAPSPVRAYAEGLRARLRADAPAAARWLSGALDGHGDACRAAGEYLAALRLIGQPLGRELDPLRAVNARCVNLTLPPPPGPPPPRRSAR